MQDSDQFGNALRAYYKTFGMQQEGPPENVNINQLFPNLDHSKEINLINRICNNEADFIKFLECKELTEFIANSLGGQDFINEIDHSISSIGDSEKGTLTNGIFWHYMASLLDPVVGRKYGINIPFDALPGITKDFLQIQGSLIFRLYITLIYMKEGPLIRLTNEAAKNRKPISQKATKLLRCDYVRHLRNALAHSTFESTSFGIYFNDENKFETVASPEFINSLTSWIMLLNFQCSTVIDTKLKN